MVFMPIIEFEWFKEADLLRTTRTRMNDYRSISNDFQKDTPPSEITVVGNTKIIVYILDKESTISRTWIYRTKTPNEEEKLDKIWLAVLNE